MDHIIRHVTESELHVCNISSVVSAMERIMKATYKTYMCALFFPTNSVPDFFPPAINIEHLTLKTPTKTCAGFHVKFLF